MPEENVVLYNREQAPDTAFLLEEGRVLFYQNTTDNYALSGRKLILGTTELIIKHILERPVFRLESACLASGSSIKSIPLEKFKLGLTSHPFVINTSATLAKQVALTNEIIGRSMTELEGSEIKLRDSAIEYFLLVDRLQDAYEKRKFPWLLPLVNEAQKPFCYRRGEAYYKSSRPTVIGDVEQLSECMVQYPRGSVICEQGRLGNEMYIVQRGSIDVVVNGSNVASIEGSGTVIGEMAMLLGEKRSATLIAKNSVVLTKISKADLKALSAKDLRLPLIIMKSLAKRHYYNLIKIADVSANALRKAMAAEGKRDDHILFDIEETRSHVKKLREKIERLYTDKRHDFLKQILKTDKNNSAV